MLTQTFDIRNFLDRLTPAKGSNRYICPHCAGNNLTIDPKSGKYQCWSGCDNKDVRETIRPWEEAMRGAGIETRSGSYSLRPYPQAPRRQQQSKRKSAQLAAQKIELARLAEVPHDIPQATKNNRIWREKDLPPVAGTETVYWYSPDRWIKRYDWEDADKPKGKDKRFQYYHRDENGFEISAKGDVPWPAYREEEALRYGVGTWVCDPEGEKCVEAARSLGLVAITHRDKSFYGSNYKKLKDALVGGVLILEDNDSAGETQAKEKAAAAEAIGLPWLIVKMADLWPECPAKGDIADWISMHPDWEREEFVRRLEAAFQQAIDRDDDAIADETAPHIPDSFDSEITEFNQHVVRWLYSDVPWICHSHTLYKWTGTHYESVPDTEHIRQISAFANTFRVVGKGEKVSYPYAKPGAVRAALQWVKDNTAVSPSLIDPPGLNCTNGVLELRWTCVTAKPTVSWELVPHSPEKYYYTYEPIATYDPDANPEHCDRLLAALDPAQLGIFLKTLAASFDLPTIRRYFGRLVRALLLKGDGSNGKDTLRELAALLYGRRGLTSATLTDFAAYDDGRRFSLACTIDSRINWASENANSTRLDKIQSLKAFVTGDPLFAEKKGKDAQEFTPKAIAIFNCNDTPRLTGSLEAIKSRYGILIFNKTFKIGADPSKGEIEADPRFKYDPEFLKNEVLPAFLNKVLAALVSLTQEGIDYDCTESALAAIQAENSHLFQFAQDTGLDYDPNRHLTAAEIWAELEQWYVANGTLTYEENDKGKQKAIWAEQANPSDRNVKAVNQVIARFKQLFPKAKLVSIPHPSGKRALQALQGLSFGVPTPPTPIPTPIPHQSPHQQTLINQGSHTTHTNFEYSGENEENLVTSSEQIKAPTPPTTLLTSDQNVNEVPEIGVGGVEVPICKDLNGVAIGVETGVEQIQTGVGCPAEQLAALVRVATTYEQVEAAKAQYPGLSKEAAKLLTPEEKRRIRALKPAEAIAPQPKSAEEELALRLGAARTQEEFEAIAKNYTGSPKDRDLLEDAITLVDAPFDRRCQLMRWWEPVWRDR